VALELRTWRIAPLSMFSMKMEYGVPATVLLAVAVNTVYWVGHSRVLLAAIDTLQVLGEIPASLTTPDLGTS
jgi:hypothetical protein